MFHWLPGPIKGVLATILFVLNTVVWCTCLYLITFVRIFAFGSFRDTLSNAMLWVAETWIACNSREIRLMHDVKFNVHLPSDLHRDRSYLVISNHQSWVDIVAIQHVLNRRIPFLRFFLKNELRYVPLLGLAWKALDFPFMKRYSKEYLAKHPEKRGEDLIETKRATEKLRGKPISILNFLEGTRFTPEKHRRAPIYKHLLPPKTGGIAFVIEAMGDQFEAILDITLHYPGGAGSLWDLFSGRIDVINVNVKRVEIPPELLNGNYFGDDLFRSKMQEWIQTLWTEKDTRLAELT